MKNPIPPQPLSSGGVLQRSFDLAIYGDPRDEETISARIAIGQALNSYASDQAKIKALVGALEAIADQANKAYDSADGVTRPDLHNLEWHALAALQQAKQGGAA